MRWVVLSRAAVANEVLDKRCLSLGAARIDWTLGVMSKKLI